MTGIIITIPPTVELPPGNNNNNPASLPGVSYVSAFLAIPQTWTAAQTYLPDTFRLAGPSIGALTLNAAASGAITFPAGTTDFSATGGASKVVKQTTLGGPFTVGQLSYSDISGPSSAAFDALAPTTTRGDIIYRNATTNTRLPAGTNGYLLQANGAGADPSWAGFLQAGTGAVSRSFQDKARDIVSVTDFGAKGDTLSVSGATSITSGAAALTVVGASFVAADVGKLIIVPGAGAAGVDLYTTILSWTDATHVTLNANAGTTLSAVTKTVNYGTDDTTAIQNAINSLPATGGDVHLPLGTYKITSSIVIGNGSGSVASTRYGVRLVGAGVSISGIQTWAAFGLATATCVKLLWGNASANNMLVVQGSIEGWGIENILFDGNRTCANGLVAYNASFGDCANLTFWNIPVSSIDFITIGTGTNTMHNTFRNTVIRLPAVNGAKGIFLDGIANFSNSCYNTFINTSITVDDGSFTNYGIYLRMCDTNTFINTHIFNGGALTYPVVLDYQAFSSWPVSNIFYNIDAMVGDGTHNWTNLGTPLSTHAANFIIGLGTGNGAAPPNLPNLSYLGHGQLCGAQTNDDAVAGAVGQEIISTVAFGAAVALTSGAPANITSITLTPGDWDISSICYFRPAASTSVVWLGASISPTSATNFQSPGRYSQLLYPNSVLGANDVSASIPPTRVSVATNTTYYLVAYTSFAASTLTAWGVLRARRPR